MRTLSLQAEVDDAGRLKLDVPTNLPKGQVDVVLVLSPHIPENLLADRFFLSFPGLSEADRELFRQFEERVDVVGLLADDNSLHGTIAAMRSRHRLKLPDAIIAATADRSEALLVTAAINFRPLGSAVVWI